MAWFNNDNNDAVAPAQLTPDRMTALLKKLEFEGNDSEPGMFYCYVNGAPIRFDATKTPFALLINVSLFEHKLPPERHDELKLFCNDFNLRTYYVHAFVTEDSDDGQLIACADSQVLAGDPGLTQEQFEEAFDTALVGVIRFAEAYCEHFGFTLGDQ
ncbi:YbjN domain-containing protein [Corynebacterium mendelii]|uniref:YbjN domain-containing protein n=1 Tax=Corynebacterium mendelii TaxID=2765362 RepID=A0A939E2N6_9CORY|nr:YbjN domain-containing protein [Corynebacterium mendelii]MBN9644581.1 YbjN domain-containing protein [Corynebacterium mendelii]